MQIIINENLVDEKSQEKIILYGRKILFTLSFYLHLFTPFIINILILTMMMMIIIINIDDKIFRLNIYFIIPLLTRLKILFIILFRSEI